MTSQGTSEVTNGVTRRQAIRRGAAAGAVIWAVPTVVSSTAHATNGSNGSLSGGPLDGVTCVWDSTYFQPNRGTSVRPKFDLSTAAFCEINVGKGWQLLARNEKFVIPAGQVCQYRPFAGHTGGRTAEPLDAPVDPPTTTLAPSTDEAAPPEPTTPTPPETTVPAAPQPTPQDAPDAGPTTTTASALPGDNATTQSAPAVAPPDPSTTAVVDIVVIDMSGRTDVAIGDVYGYFRVVDLDPA